MRARRTLPIAAIVLAVVMLVVANVLAREALDLFAADAGGFTVFVNAIGFLVLTAVSVGAIIRLRVPDNRIGPLLIVGALIVMSVFVAWPFTVVAGRADGPPSLLAGSVAWWATITLVPGMFLLLPTVGLIFPDGRLPSPRWRRPFRLTVALLAIATVLQTIAPWAVTEEQPIPNPFALPGVPATVSEVGGALAAGALFAAFGLAATGIAVRFRRSRAAERAQMKWLLASTALMAVVFPISFATEIGPAGLIDVASVIVGACMPLAIGIAILRYRLFEIDRLISRTVGWAIVTGVLVAVFVAGVLSLQTLLSDVTQGETLAVAASTLLAFALFQPMRRRVQRAVDRRFDRSGYDSQRTAETFARDIRREVDLPRLRSMLASTADDAVRPSATSVWLRHRTGEPSR